MLCCSSRSACFTSLCRFCCSQKEKCESQGIQDTPGLSTHGLWPSFIEPKTDGKTFPAFCVKSPKVPVRSFDDLSVFHLTCRVVSGYQTCDNFWLRILLSIEFCSVANNMVGHGLTGWLQTEGEFDLAEHEWKKHGTCTRYACSACLLFIMVQVYKTHNKVTFAERKARQCIAQSCRCPYLGLFIIFTVLVEV